MGKFGYGLLALMLCVCILLLIPHSPVYPLAARYVQKKVGARWNFRIVQKRISANPLDGTLTIDHLWIETPETANPTWRLRAERVTVIIRYVSLIGNKTIDGLILDGPVFEQQHRKAADPLGQREALPGKEPEKPESDPSPAEGSETPKGFRISRLEIRNGTFETLRTDPSGGKQRIKADRISVVRKNVYLNRSPDAFFRDIFNTDPGR